MQFTIKPVFAKNTDIALTSKGKGQRRYGKYQETIIQRRKGEHFSFYVVQLENQTIAEFATQKWDIQKIG